MKHLKIKLSVLALACLGAGAFALQPANYAKAEGEMTYNADGVVMAEGAAVSLGAGFSGIRWSTTIDEDWYSGVYKLKETVTQTNEETGEEEEVEKKVFKGIRFGVVVMPTAQLGDNELTVETTGAMDLHAEGWKVSQETQTFYSVISYDKLLEQYEGEMTEEEVLQAAYSMELTARAYVRYTLNDGSNTWVYAYADMVDSSRSARQVALAAELAGELDALRESTDANTQAKAQKAAGYYGYGADANDYYQDFVVSNGAAGTQYIDLSAVATAAQDYAVTDFAIADGYTINEVFVGTKPVEATYADGTLTLNLKEGQALPTGETYVVAYAKNAEGDVAVYTKPIIGATKVLTTTDDLKMFNAKGTNGVKSTKVGETLDDDGDGEKETYHNYYKEGYWSADQEQGGYYVLGADINATGYSHGSGNTSTWNGADNYEGYPIGLTGTFNGLGYAIDYMKINTKAEGFFGIVNGGTVKNVAFTNVISTLTDASYILANYLLNATIDNVYIMTNTYNKNDKTNNPGYKYVGGKSGSGILASYAMGTTKISNVLIRINKASANTAVDSTYGALFGTSSKNESYTCENVFVYVRQHASLVVGTTTETDGETTTTYAATTLQYYMPMVTVDAAVIAEDGKSITTKGSLYLAENQTATALNNNKTLSADAYDIKTLTGVYYYGQNDTWGAYDPAGFLASGCWTAKSGTRPAWGA